MFSLPDFRFMEIEGLATRPRILFICNFPSMLTPHSTRNVNPMSMSWMPSDGEQLAGCNALEPCAGQMQVTFNLPPGLLALLCASLILISPVRRHLATSQA